MKKQQDPGQTYRPLHTPLSKAIHVLCSASVVLSSFAPLAASAQASFKYKAYVKDLLATGSTPTPSDGAEVPGQLAITPSYHDYGNVPIQTTSEVVFTARNLATDPQAVIALGQPTVSGSSAFSLTHSCPLYLAAGSTCEVRVRFRPSATQTYQGSFSFSSANNFVPPLPVATLWGQGVTANLALSPDPQSFDALEVGDTSEAKTVTLSNTAQIPQDLASITSTSANFQVQSNTCPPASNQAHHAPSPSSPPLRS